MTQMAFRTVLVRELTVDTAAHGERRRPSFVLLSRGLHVCEACFQFGRTFHEMKALAAKIAPSTGGIQLCRAASSPSPAGSDQIRPAPAATAMTKKTRNRPLDRLIPQPPVNQAMTVAIDARPTNGMPADAHCANGSSGRRDGNRTRPTAEDQDGASNDRTHLKHRHQTGDRISSRLRGGLDQSCGRVNLSGVDEHAITVRVEVKHPVRPPDDGRLHPRPMLGPVQRGRSRAGTAPRSPGIDTLTA